MYYVYIWIITESKEVFYVGKGKGSRYKQTYNRNKFFKDMYNSHKCHCEIVASNLNEEDAFKLERETIAYYKEYFPNYRLTNQTEGGEGVSGWNPSDDWRKKQASLSKKRWENPLFRQKMIDIRNNKNGVYQSIEFRKKISKLVTGVKNPNYNNKWTNEQKQHLSDLRKAKKLGVGETNGNSKKVMCVENGEIFDFIQLALEKYNIKSHSNLSTALNNKNKTAGKLHWIHITEDNLEYWLKKDNRIKYYYECLLSNKKKPYINIKNKEIFILEKDLLKHLNITRTYFKYNKNKYDNYIELEKYYGRIYQ